MVNTLKNINPTYQLDLVVILYVASTVGNKRDSLFYLCSVLRKRVGLLN